MRVLSLFDGISCGRFALEQAGVTVEKYYASEIEKSSIKVATTNYPDIIELGSVTEWREWNIEWDKIDMLIGGSPCQGFSFAGKQLNFNDPRSKLFFEYVDILNFLKKKNPNIKFLLENVKMKKEYENIITEKLGVEPIEINSSLLSAQNRVRLYWVGKAVNSKIEQIKISYPTDAGINLEDILEEEDLTKPGAIRGRKLYKATIIGRRLNDEGHREDYNKSIPITQCLEVRKTNTNKSNCLTTVGKDNVLTSLTPGRYKNAFSGEYPFRYYTLKEYCRLQTLPDDYCDSISVSKAKAALGNGWTASVIAHIFKNMDLN